VSQSTVSRVLSGVLSHRVSHETRARVLEAARRLDYQPNRVARSLRDGRTRLIGFYDTWADETFDAEHEFLARIIGGLQRGCSAHDHDLLLHSPMRGRPAEDVFGKLAGGRVDGLVLHGDLSDPLVERLVRSSIPLVVIVDKVEDAPSITVHDWDGVRQLVKYLRARRYRRFAFVGPRGEGGGPLQRGYDFRGMLFERGVKEVPMLRMDSDMSEPPLDETPSA